MVRLIDAPNAFRPSETADAPAVVNRGAPPPKAPRRAEAPLVRPARSRAFGLGHDAVETDQVFLGGRPMGMAITLGDRLQFFTTLEELRALDGARFGSRAELIARLRKALSEAA
jgi:hypothetical protein